MNNFVLTSSDKGIRKMTVKWAVDAFYPPEGCGDFVIFDFEHFTEKCWPVLKTHINKLADLKDYRYMYRWIGKK